MSLLESLMTPEDCAKCQFCCSFRRCSLWETPIFTAEEIEKLSESYPEAKFKKIRNNGCDGFMIDVDANYTSDDPEEEVFCTFNKGKGCIMKDGVDKSFECSAWPFRVMKKDGKTVIAYCKDCRVFAKKSIDEIRSLLDSGLGKKMTEYAKQKPVYIRDYRENYYVLKILDEA